MTTTPTSGAADLPEARLFTKKPVTISATQWFKNGDHPQVRAIAPSDDLFFTGMGGAMLTGREKYGVIGTLESPNHLVTPGDWIITGVAGEHYACKPDIFEATYSPAALAAGQATAAQHGAGITAGMEPAATVRTLGVVGVKFSGWTDYGCSLPDGTKLYTEAQVQAHITAAPQPAPPADSVQEDAACEAIEKVLALFPFNALIQKFSVNNGPCLTADNDDEFYSVKRVLAFLTEIKTTLDAARKQGATP